MASASVSCRYVKSGRRDAMIVAREREQIRLLHSVGAAPETAKTNVKAHTAKIDLLTKENSTLRSALMSKDAAITKITQDYNASEKVLSEQKSRISFLNELVNRFTERWQVQEHEQQQKINELEAKIHEHHKTAHCKIEGLEAEMAGKDASAAAAQKDSNSRMIELKKTLAGYVQAYQDEVTEKNAILDGTQSEFAKLSKDLASCRYDLDSKSDEVELLKKMLSTRTCELLDVETNTVAKLEAEIQGLRSETKRKHKRRRTAAVEFSFEGAAIRVGPDFQAQIPELVSPL